MTPIEINENEFLATKLMGWELHGAYYFERVGVHGMRSVVKKEYWDPFENIAQAFEVVEKIREKGHEFMIQGQKNRYVACFGENVGWGQDPGIDKNPATAITLAACRALGWKEKGDERLRKNRLA